MYRVFHRTWWKHNHSWPNGLEPCCGEEHTICNSVELEEEARDICQEYNAAHGKGELSDKAEYEEI